VSRRAGVSIVLWSVDTCDWTGQREGDAAGIRQRARLGLRQPHPVVLLHDGGGYRGATVAALPGIIADFRSRGYTFVTLDGRS
jgi:peptidoglycan/xylan/chitin deacetylase (PgdA/CDA1 family)